MINKVMASNNSPNFGFSAKGGKNLTTKFLKSEALGKVLDVAAENQTLCQSLFAFGICVGPRPVTNYVVTEDKKDALYANCHSISSGAIGLAWPLVFATPIAAGLKRIGKNPAKYLKPEAIQRFYPSVGIKEEAAKEGKAAIKKVMTNENGEMLRKDGSVLCQSLEPLMVYGEEAQANFMKNYPNHIVDKNGVVRIKPIKTEDGGWQHIQTSKGVGKFNIDKNKAVPVGEPIQAKGFKVEADGSITKPIYETDSEGKYVLKENPKTGKKEKVEIGREQVKEEDFTPITEEMEIGTKKEQNVHKFINMVPDILLAPARASLTIAMIPPVLNVLGVKKSDKSQKSGGLNIVSTNANSIVRTPRTGGIGSSFNALRRGGAQ